MAATSYLDWDDPNHPRNCECLPDGRVNPEYVKPAKVIPSQGVESKRKQTGNEAAKSILDSFK